MKNIEEEATGVTSAGDYKNVAHDKGYKFIDVLDWTSSAGDWSFIVSKDGEEWQIMFQENNYPYAGFTYYFSEELFYGSKTDVFKQIETETRY